MKSKASPKQIIALIAGMATGWLIVHLIATNWAAIKRFFAP